MSDPFRYDALADERRVALYRLWEWAYDKGIRGVEDRMHYFEPGQLVEAIMRDYDMIRAVAEARVVEARKVQTDVGEADVIRARP